MKRVAFLGTTANHINHTYVMRMLLGDDVGSFVIYATKDVFDATPQELIDSPNTRFEMPKEGESYTSFLLRKRSEVNAFDTVIVDEIYRFRRFLGLFSLFRIKPKLYLNLHDLNSWVNPNPKVSFMERVRNCARRYLLKRSSGIIVISPKIREYVQSNAFYGKEIVYIPFGIPNETLPERVDADEIVYCVPGYVDPTRRDYFPLLKAIEPFWASGNSPKRQLVFLGQFLDKPENETLRAEVDRLKSQYGEESIRTWNHRLTPDAFDEELARTDYLLCQLQLTYVALNGTEEQYGKTKESGVRYLALQKGLPIICNQEYDTFMTGVSPIYTFGSSEELGELMGKLPKRPVESGNDALQAANEQYLEEVRQEALRLIK